MLKRRVDNALALLNIVCTVYFVYYVYQIVYNGAYRKNPLCWLCCSVMWVLTGYLIWNFIRERKR